MCKKFLKYLIFTFIFTFTSLILSTSVEATYKNCNKKVEGTNLYDCGDKIYTYYEDVMNSSIIYASNKDARILYVGEFEGVSLFYASKARLYNVSYDDRSSDNNNLWTILLRKGDVLFDGSFNDSWIIDDGHRGYYWSSLRKDVYTINQYHHDGELHRTIVIQNRDDYKITLKNINYDGNDFNSDKVNEVLDPNLGLTINLESLYGILDVKVVINGNEVNAKVSNGSAFVDKEELAKYLVKGEVVNVKVIARDYFANEESITYKVLLLNNSVSIKLETINSIISSTSRRIVVSASAGKGKTLDTDYCWYYWSTSPDDSLLYDDFLRNYATSDYKGSYSEDKGVILRNTSGTYYLYALAKDDDSYIVVKSDGYNLNDQGYKFYYHIDDAIFIVSLLIICVIPISIYLYIRKKGY